MRWLAFAVVLAGCEKLFPLVPPDAAPVIDAPSCDVLDGYEIRLLGDDVNHRYHEDLATKTWRDAEAKCESDHPHAHLFVPDSQAELEALRSRTTQTEKFHIGIARAALSTIDDFRTITGHPVPRDDERWDPGEPNDAGGGNLELVTQLDFPPTPPDPAGIADINEDLKQGYICECDSEPPVRF